MARKKEMKRKEKKKKQNKENRKRWMIDAIIYMDFLLLLFLFSLRITAEKENRSFKFLSNRCDRLHQFFFYLSYDFTNCSKIFIFLFNRYVDCSYIRINFSKKKDFYATQTRSLYRIFRISEYIFHKWMFILINK